MKTAKPPAPADPCEMTDKQFEDCIYGPSQCKHELETHCDTEINAAGTHREYWRQCVKCGAIFDSEEAGET